MSYALNQNLQNRPFGVILRVSEESQNTEGIILNSPDCPRDSSSLLSLRMTIGLCCHPEQNEGSLNDNREFFIYNKVLRP